TPTRRHHRASIYRPRRAHHTHAPQPHLFWPAAGGRPEQVALQVAATARWSAQLSSTSRARLTPVP
ncbi:hypothetical protein, partial [Kitasatospora aureofaciens]|uniref:hypothetical protein n=1 Tax=Kitasatospora aureofaciens TaxID=1894 RepID=UPI001ADF922F